MDQDLRQRVWLRAHAACEYCLVPERLSTLAFEVDPIVAIKHEGETVAANLALACYCCTTSRGPTSLD
ncbi:MAG: HNH endonuclease [Gemmataceae bacterium]|nr:HNH endonuclease [Gemmataceae bacterium]